MNITANPQPSAQLVTRELTQDTDTYCNNLLLTGEKVIKTSKCLIHTIMVDVP
jgi:hypothetical protein